MFSFHISAAVIPMVWRGFIVFIAPPPRQYDMGVNFGVFPDYLFIRTWGE